MPQRNDRRKNPNASEKEDRAANPRLQQITAILWLSKRGSKPAGQPAQEKELHRSTG